MQRLLTILGSCSCHDRDEPTNKQQNGHFSGLVDPVFGAADDLDRAEASFSLSFFLFLLIVFPC